MVSLAIQRTYDSFAAYLRDCIWKVDRLGAKNAEVKLRELDVELAKTEP